MEARFDGSRMKRAQIIHSDLRRGGFQRCDLQFALIEHCRLDLTNFGDATLHTAKMHGCSREGANLDGANLTLFEETEEGRLKAESFKPKRPRT